MNRTRQIARPLICLATCILAASTVISQESPRELKNGVSSQKQQHESSKLDKTEGFPLAVARDRAKVMHEVYEATLEVMHHRYFHGDRATVPARAMQDIFSTIERQSKMKARWISVNMKPMSIDHEPETEFEKTAAKAISKGKSHVDVVENGYYRRAGAIPLRSGCVGCHGGLSSGASTTPKFAGLVISVPLSENESSNSAR